MPASGDSEDDYVCRSNSDYIGTDARQYLNNSDRFTLVVSKGKPGFIRQHVLDTFCLSNACKYFLSSLHWWKLQEL
jgi:hypothetical protein